ncbi:MAG: L,D-transpeptidase family protein [Alphaproteobacteria bacterium]
MNGERPISTVKALAAALAVQLVVTASAAGGAGDGAERHVLLGDMLGKPRHYRVRTQDTLLDVARRFELGYTELIAANPKTDPWLPKPGTELILPTGHLLPDAPRTGIIINLADQRIYYFPPQGGAGKVASFPVGIGKQGFKTPEGGTRIVRKRTDPYWIPPESVRAEYPELPKVVAPGPNNPLGAFALDLGWPSYVIHGTNIPWGIGRRVSRGCIRLYPEDIADLFSRVELGTAITVVDQPVKVGWSEGELYVEIHPSQAQADEIENTGRFTPQRIPELEHKIVSAAGKHAKRLNWPAINRAARARSGVPIRITLPAAAPADGMAMDGMAMK